MEKVISIIIILTVFTTALVVTFFLAFQVSIDLTNLMFDILAKFDIEFRDFVLEDLSTPHFVIPFSPKCFVVTSHKKTTLYSVLQLQGQCCN